MSYLKDVQEKNQREILKNGTLKEKLQYLWDYYGMWFCLIAGTVAIIIGILISVMTKKEPVLNGIFLNSYSFAHLGVLNEVEDMLLEELELDQKDYEFTVNTSLYYSVDENSNVDNTTASQTMITQVSTAKLDFILGDLETMLSVAYSDFFIDLSTVLTEEQFVLYEPYLLYIDQAVLDVMNAEEASDITSVTIPDYDKPDTMEKPVPIMIDVSRCEFLKEFYVHVDEPIVMGWIHNAPHAESMQLFVNFMME